MNDFLILIKSSFELFQDAFREWSRDQASLLAAALAYYSLFSLIPLLIMTMIFVDFLFPQGIQGGGAVQQAQDLIGPQAPQVVGDLIDIAGDLAASFRFTVLSLLLMILGATSLFVNTKKAFQIIWSSSEAKETFMRRTIKPYLRSFLLIAAVAFMLLASSIVTAFLMPIGRQIEEQLPVQLGLLRLVTFLISSVFVTLLFAVTYMTLSEVKLGWRDVLPGSALAALLLAIGNYVIEVYVSIVNIGSAFGAAGSLVVFLFWIYYSAQIFLYGVEFIKVQKRRRNRQKREEKI